MPRRFKAIKLGFFGFCRMSEAICQKEIKDALDLLNIGQSNELGAPKER